MSGNKSFLKILGCGGDLQIVVFGDSQADGKKFFFELYALAVGGDAKLSLAPHTSHLVKLSLPNIWLIWRKSKWACAVINCLLSSFYIMLRYTTHYWILWVVTPPDSKPVN